MSGGSWDYLAMKDATELFEEHESKLIESMAARLEELGYSHAAREFEELYLQISHAKRKISARWAVLSHIAYAVEWYDSGDSGKDHIDKAIEKAFS